MSMRSIGITSTLLEGSCYFATALLILATLPEESLSEIFEPFYSTKPTTGTGLGLGVVKRLVQLYGGTIEAVSVVGEGSRFFIMLPGAGNALESFLNEGNDK